MTEESEEEWLEEIMEVETEETTFTFLYGPNYHDLSQALRQEFKVKREEYKNFLSLDIDNSERKRIRRDMNIILLQIQLLANKATIESHAKMMKSKTKIEVSRKSDAKIWRSYRDEARTLHHNFNKKKEEYSASKDKKTYAELKGIHMQMEELCKKTLSAV